MTQYEYKRNGWLLGLFWGFSGLNSLIAGILTELGVFIGLGAVWLMTALVQMCDKRENHRSRGDIWGAAVLHAFFTGIVMVICFRWYLLVLYLLELWLCVHIWRKKSPWK